jgi:hypothetical protein
VTIIASHRASHRRQIKRRGVPITFRRITGAAPNTTTIEKTVNAVVSTLTPDQLSTSRTGYSESLVGALAQGSRRIIVMAEDLQTAGFPLPLKKNDGITLDSGERLNVTQVDAETRAVAGAIELLAAGIR